MTATRIDRAERHFPVPPERVWQELSQAERLARWLPPEDARAEVHAFELRPGGAFRMTLLFPPGIAGKAAPSRDEVVGRIVAVDSPARLEWEVEFPSDDAANAGSMRMRWDLTPDRGGTRVTVRAFDPPAGIDADVHRQALAESLDHLAAACERSE